MMEENSNKVRCWFCEKETDIKKDDYGDHVCNHCGVELAVYNPADYKPYVPEGTESEEEVGNLTKWAKENAKFLKLTDGESYEGIYKGYKEGTNMNGDPTIIYKIDDKELKSSSTKLASEMDVIAEGSKIKISRTGEGLQTKWTVEVL